ncbi:MAG: OmpH family outer membrane protein [Chitinophagaceae bacterium]|nr:OmpH family outer membrane protein [Chitinophagaceae bacterium]
MKKLLFVCVAFAASFLFSNNTNAQQKMGYFDEQLTLSLFPGIQKIDTLLNSFQNDSLRVEYEYRVGDFTRRDSIFKKDSATMPVKARELATRELNQLKYNLINWQTYAQQMIEAKTEQLLMPYKQRMFEALKLVIAEQKYTYVLTAQALSPYAQPPLLDNLSIRVAMKLKLPLTKEIEDAWKVATGSAAPANKK